MQDTSKNSMEVRHSDSIIVLSNYSEWNVGTVQRFTGLFYKQREQIFQSAS